MLARALGSDFRARLSRRLLYKTISASASALRTRGMTLKAIHVCTEVDSTPVADLYVSQAGANNRNGFSVVNLAPGGNATPTFITWNTHYLVLNGHRKVDHKC